MTFWTPDSIRAACSGTWVVRPPQIQLPKDRPADLPLPPLHAPILGVSTDTRTIKQGQMFVALKGETHDGHDHLMAAAKAGAGLLVVHDTKNVPAGGFDPACGILKVADTGKALLKIAQAYRESLKRTKVIAVCGSNGKTTTTRLIDHLLGQTMRGTASIKSFNNAVGVPLTILSAKESDQYLICEVGTNHPGEIAVLGDVVRPDIAVITSIGREHLEGLGDLAGVAKEEAAIIKHIRGGGWLVMNADAPDLAEYAKIVRNVISFGTAASASLRLTSTKHEIGPDGELGLVFTINKRQTVRLKLIGEHNAYNAMAALGVARRLGMDEFKAAAALESAGGADMRLNVRRVGSDQSASGGVLVLNDAYNANPDSMLAGLKTLLSVRGTANTRGRCVAVLGEMLELGQASAECHQLVGSTIAEWARAPGERGIDRVLLVGAGMQAAAAALRQAGLGEVVRWWPSTEDAAPAQIALELEPGDVVLLKGSRRVRLERVMDAIEDRFKPSKEINVLGEVKGGVGVMA